MFALTNKPDEAAAGSIAAAFLFFGHPDFAQDARGMKLELAKLNERLSQILPISRQFDKKGDKRSRC